MRGCRPLLVLALLFLPARAAANAEAGEPGRAELILGAGHGWGGAELVRTVAAMNAFFEQELKPERP
ncbi:MAG TPA: hypothetical protein VFY93_00050 [Planctomycetota bacterium]|nr:hypothetical protein [Planctomycetota bacterium]